MVNDFSVFVINVSCNVLLLFNKILYFILQNDFSQISFISKDTPALIETQNKSKLIPQNLKMEKFQ